MVSLLDESTSGRTYQPRSTAYAKAVCGNRSKMDIDRERNFKVSRTLWTEGYVHTLTGPGLVFLLALLAEQAGEGKEVWFSTTAFKDRYFISHQTRTDGTKDLLELGLLKIERRLVSTGPLDRNFDMKRKRNIYTLQGPALYSS